MQIRRVLFADYSLKVLPPWRVAIGTLESSEKVSRYSQHDTFIEVYIAIVFERLQLKHDLSLSW